MINHLTIIKPNNLVGVDNKFTEIDCSSLPANFHALQWNENTSSGEIEWTGNPKPDNTVITSLGEYEIYLTKWKQANPIPTSMPTFNSDTQVCEESSPTETNGEWYQNWVVRNMTAAEVTATALAKRTRLTEEINTYRDNKIAQGFLFNGTMFDSRPEDQKRISGAGTLAFIAIANGAPAGYLYWHGGTDPFSWITQNNELVEMDAYTMVEFGKKAAEHERNHIFAARLLKDMDPIPEDYTNPSYWPA